MTKSESKGAAPSAPLRILVAEDNRMNQLVLKTLLSQIGLEPHLVDDGEAAVAAWAEGGWDVVLMDVHMPVMDGLSATREIRRREAQERRPVTPIIALTADAMSHQVESYLTVGMNGFVGKPINLSDLLTTIRNCLSEPVQDAPAPDARRGGAA